MKALFSVVDSLLIALLFIMHLKLVLRVIVFRGFKIYVYDVYRVGHFIWYGYSVEKDLYYRIF